MRRALCALVGVVLAVAACGETSKPKPGDICRGADVNRATCTDPSHLFTCRFSTWHLEECRGPRGCTSTGPRSAECDQSTALRSDVCTEAGARACSSDGKELLQCVDGQMVPAMTCRGKRGCYRDAENAPACDQGGAQIGDPCASTGDHCALDGSAIFRCTASHQYELERVCPGPKGCHKNRGFGSRVLVCDVSVGDVGEPCGGAGKGEVSCSRDGKQENVCQDGAWTASRICPNGCSVHWAADGSSYSVGCEVDGGRATLRTEVPRVRLAGY